MRILTPLFALLVATSAAAQTYRWVEKVNGVNVVNYSDTPREGAEQVQIGTGAVVATPAPRPAASAAARAGATGAAPPAATTPFRYESCAISQPANEQSLMENEGVTVQASLKPAKRANDKVLINFDGTLMPANGTSLRVSPIYRGEHSVSVVVRDAAGTTLCQSPGSAFYVQQPSILRPRAP